MAYPSIESAKQAMQQQARGGITSNFRDYESVPLSSPPALMGIASALQELNTAVCATSKLAQTCRASLGITCPENEGKAANIGSMLDMLCDLRARLNRANEDFETIIGHINS